jgi:hypothetical protein
VSAIQPSVHRRWDSIRRGTTKAPSARCSSENHQSFLHLSLPPLDYVASRKPRRTRCCLTEKLPCTDIFVTCYAFVRLCCVIYNELLVKTLQGNHTKSVLQARFRAHGSVRNSLLPIVEGTIEKEQGILSVLAQGAVAIG